MLTTYEITIVDGDTVFDIAMREYGQATGLLQMIMDNPTIFATEYTPVLNAGDAMIISIVPTQPEVKKSLVDYARSLKNG